VKKQETRSIPSDWILESQTKECSRYHTPTVVKLMKGLLVAREELNLAAEAAWQHFVTEVDKDCYGAIMTLLDVLGELDA